jgi:CRP/FNR family transcriptional regulator
VKGVIVAEKDSTDGKTLVAATFGSGDVFWGLAFFLDGSPMPAAYKVFEDGQILLWSREDMEPLLKENGTLSWELGRLAVKRMIKASEIIESMTFHPIAVRLARLLTGIQDSNQKSIERNLTLDEMAARIGSTREMVCRLLYKFSDEGLIKITRTEFTIIDAETLNQRAQR